MLKKQRRHFIIIKKHYICGLKIKIYRQLNNIKDEEDISAVKKEESEQTWFQGKDVHTLWQKSYCGKKSKREKETHSLLRNEVEMIFPLP